MVHFPLKDVFSYVMKKFRPTNKLAYRRRQTGEFAKGARLPALQMAERSAPCFPLPNSSAAKNHRHPRSVFQEHPPSGQFFLSTSCIGPEAVVGAGLAFGAVSISNQTNVSLSSPNRPRSLDIPMNMCGGGEAISGYANTASKSQPCLNAGESRKRKPSFSEDECMEGLSSRSSESPIPNHEGTADTFSPSTNAEETDLSGKKRAKVGGSQKLPLQELLNTLEKPELVQLVCLLISEYPKLQADVMSHIPRPTLQRVHPLLQQLEKKLQNLYPYNKLGPGRDDYSFNRVKPTIIDIRNILTDYAAHFTSPNEFPTTTFTYLCSAVNLTCRLPDWDRPENNTIKRDLLYRLAGYYRKAIQDASSKCSEGKIFGVRVVDVWGKNLLQHCKDAKKFFSDSNRTSATRKLEDVTFPDVLQQFVQQLGWMCSQHTLMELSQFANSI